jgi:hypothetical protein
VLRDSFELSNVLSDTECDAIVRLSDAIGFQRPTCGGGIGSKEASPPPDRLVWVTDQAWCDQVYQRLKGRLPASIQGRPPVGINPRWRLYRYESGFALERHQDRSFKASGADEHGELRYDVLRDGSESLLTLLVYLNGGMQGGGTTLYERDDAASVLAEVSPQPGAALLFPHGRNNPDSVWHAGMPLTAGCKYIIRTDVVYGPVPKEGPWADHGGRTADVGADAASDIGMQGACDEGPREPPAAGPPPAHAAAGEAAAGGMTWDETLTEAARTVFRTIDEDEIGWMDADGIAHGLALFGYPTSGDGARISADKVEVLLGGMDDEREDVDFITIDEFCRLCRTVRRCVGDSMSDEGSPMSDAAMGGGEAPILRTQGTVQYSTGVAGTR